MRLRSLIGLLCLLALAAASYSYILYQQEALKMIGMETALGRVVRRADTGQLVIQYQISSQSYEIGIPTTFRLRAGDFVRLLYSRANPGVARIDEQRAAMYLVTAGFFLSTVVIMLAFVLRDSGVGSSYRYAQ